MEPLFYVMAIMGCGDGQSRCTTARIEPAQYHSIQQCQAEMPAALARNTDLSYPVISAACQGTGAAMARVGGKAMSDRRG